MENYKKDYAFTLAEVLMAKRMSDKTCSQEFVRVSEPKAPTNIINKLCAFTLAEVLITLAIIGVVAALTIPTVVKNYKERQTVTALKKAYSTINQAYQMATINNGNVYDWDWDNAEEIYNIFKPYLRINKYCGFGEGCFVNEKMKNLKGIANLANYEESDKHIKFVLADGSAWAIYSTFVEKCQRDISTDGMSPLNEVCTGFEVDLNGKKGPNQFGVDVFSFYVLPKIIYPKGTPRETLYVFGENKTGHATSAWVLQNENLDYLKCDDLSWSGKHKCN